jgi:hypothetical protein
MRNITPVFLRNLWLRICGWRTLESEPRAENIAPNAVISGSRVDISGGNFNQVINVTVINLQPRELNVDFWFIFH